MLMTRCYIYSKKPKETEQLARLQNYFKEIMSEVILFGPKLLRNILDYIIRWYLFSL